MLHAFEDRIKAVIKELGDEASRRRETTPSDVAAEAFDFAAKRVERALAEANAATETVTPAEYGELHGGLTAQTVTRWIRLGELAAEHTPGGYRIARDAVRVPRIHADKIGRAS